MSLTSQDLKAIKGLLQEQKIGILTILDEKQTQQTVEIAHVINQAFSKC